MLGNSGVISSPNVNSRLLVGYVRLKGKSTTVSSVSHCPSPSLSRGTELLSEFVVPQSCSSSSLQPSPSSSSSTLLQIRSPSESTGVELLSALVVPHSDSCVSVQPSLSSSSSAISPVDDSPFNSSGIPSPSVSTDAALSFGKASGPATQIVSFGVLGPSQIPSPSESAFIVLVCSSPSSIWSPELASSSFGIPSPSMSSSNESQTVSPSRSEGIDCESVESVEQSFSEISLNPSPSSSRSSIRSPE